MHGRMRKYDIITETRHLEVQWGKVLLRRKDKGQQRKELPPPYGRIKRQNSGTILGKSINVLGSLKNAVTERDRERVKKAHQTWKQINYKLLRNKAIAVRIKLILRISLVRSTVIYGLHTTETPESQTKGWNPPYTKT